MTFLGTLLLSHLQARRAIKKVVECARNNSEGTGHTLLLICIGYDKCVEARDLLWHGIWDNGSCWCGDGGSRCDCVNMECRRVGHRRTQLLGFSFCLILFPMSLRVTEETSTFGLPRNLALAFSSRLCFGLLLASPFLPLSVFPLYAWPLPPNWVLQESPCYLPACLPLEWALSYAWKRVHVSLGQDCRWHAVVQNSNKCL